MSKPYPPDLRDRAVRLVLETKDQYPSEPAAIKSIAAKLGIGTAQTLTNWVRRAEIDAGSRPGTTTAESEQVKALKREVAELRRANETSHASWCQAVAVWGRVVPGKAMASW
jgi:transposase